MDQAKDCEMTNLELFKNFKNMDRNLFEVLQVNEFIECLWNLNQEFNEEELVSLSLMADIEGNDQIDYEEFMKHIL